jgi:hypothetical protein
MAPVYYSQHGEEYMNNTEEEDVETFFVYENFDDYVYDRLRDANCRIIGPPVIFKCAEDGKVGDVNFETQDMDIVSCERLGSEFTLPVH